MSKKTKDELPKAVYITREVEDEDDYLMVWEDLDSIDADTVVGLYELTAKKTMRVTRSLD